MYAFVEMCCQIAAAKGLIAGAFIITRGDGSTIDGSKEREVGLRLLSFNKLAEINCKGHTYT